MRQQPQRFTVADPVFKTETLFVLGMSFEDLRAYVRRRCQCDVGEYVGQCGQMFTFTEKPPHFRIVWVEDVTDLPCLVHEIVHLVTRICADKGVPIRAHFGNESGDETAAYLTEFYVTAAFRRLGLPIGRTA